MIRQPRRQEDVRRMLGGAPVALPPELTGRAVELGERIARRRRTVRFAGWMLLFALAAAFSVWAAAVEPWQAPPEEPTTLVEGY
ncbi:hypothetical protein AB0G74_13455 [Streptomyces sp. NPDC020875]|uniref:hypothetical protein n=1 Tax=Streptomyces sp. NPDC020875 TaxID=3154898 RepID=UPI0034096D65